MKGLLLEAQVELSNKQGMLSHLETSNRGHSWTL